MQCGDKITITQLELIYKSVVIDGEGEEGRGKGGREEREGGREEREGGREGGEGGREGEREGERKKYMTCYLIIFIIRFDHNHFVCSLTTPTAVLTTPTAVLMPQVSSRTNILFLILLIQVHSEQIVQQYRL